MYTFFPVLKSYLSNPGVIGSYIYTFAPLLVDNADPDVVVEDCCETTVGDVFVMLGPAPPNGSRTDAALALACLNIASG